MLLRLTILAPSASMAVVEVTLATDDRSPDCAGPAEQSPERREEAAAKEARHRCAGWRRGLAAPHGARGARKGAERCASLEADLPCCAECVHCSQCLQPACHEGQNEECCLCQFGEHVSTKRE